MTDTIPEASSGPTRQARHTTDNYHPAMRDFDGRRMPAGHLWLVVVIALGIALLFNSAGFLRDANGMRPGVVRTVMIGIATPVDAVAGWLRLDVPARTLATWLGQSTDETDGGALTADVSEPPAAATAPPITTPTPNRPLRVLVMGDSLATYVGQQMATILADSDLIRVKTVWRNGTGLTNPQFFNWESGARSIVRSEQPDAVIVLIGGNERNDMVLRGRTLVPGDDDWEAEYERRARVVMRAIMSEGVQRVFWSGPPTARDRQWNDVYADVNAAVARAASVVAGVQYVDLYDDGEPFAMRAVIEGESVTARQRDGIHWTYPGAFIPARQEVAALESVYGDVNPESSTTEVPLGTDGTRPAPRSELAGS